MWYHNIANCMQSWEFYPKLEFNENRAHISRGHLTECDITGRQTQAENIMS